MLTFRPVNNHKIALFWTPTRLRQSSQRWGKNGDKKYCNKWLKTRTFSVLTVFEVLISLLIRYQTLKIWWKPSFSPGKKKNKKLTMYTFKSQHTTLGDSQTLKSKPCIVSIDNRGIWESTELETGWEVDHSSENKHTCKLASLSPCLTSSSIPHCTSWIMACRLPLSPSPASMWGNSTRSKGKWTILRGSAAEWWPAWKTWRV